jgi:hypothetical protein
MFCWVLFVSVLLAGLASSDKHVHMSHACYLCSKISWSFLDRYKHKYGLVSRWTGRRIPPSYSAYGKNPVLPIPPDTLTLCDLTQARRYFASSVCYSKISSLSFSFSLQRLTSFYQSIDHSQHAKDTCWMCHISAADSCVSRIWPKNFHSQKQYCLNAWLNSALRMRSCYVSLGPNCCRHRKNNC